MDYSHSQSDPRWTLSPSQSQQQPNPAPFPSPVSPGATFLFPSSSQSSTMDSRPTTSSLTLNLNGLSVNSPQTLSPVGPHQPLPGQLHPHQLHTHSISHRHQSHHGHSHSHSSGSSISPITPVSPQNIPLVSPQPQFSYNFGDPVPNSAGLSPTPDPTLTQRRSTGSLTAPSSELTVQKSVPRKRSLTSTLPVSGTTTHSMHQHSQSHSYSSSQTLPHIITTTASSPPPPTSPTSSSSHPSHSHSRSLSHSLSHSSLSQSHSQHPQLEINTNPPSPYDDIDSAGPSCTGIGDDASDDDFGSPSAGPFSVGGSFGNANLKASESSSQQPQTGMARTVGTNNFVTKLYQMINEAKSQHFITWTDLGTSFVVSNVGEFSRSILGSHFKHNNFSSFVRQLNMYGFHKINRTPRAQRTSSSSQTWEFSHPKFLRDRPDLLEAIKRKALEPDPREKNRIELPGEVARVLGELRDENQRLWREVKSLSSRIPQQGSSVAPGTASANFAGSSQGSISLNSQIGLGGGDALTHSRSSSNLGGDDGERDVDWEDEDVMNVPVGGGPMTGIGGGEEWDSQAQRFNFWAGSGLNVPGLTFNNFGTAPGGEEWKRWVEGELVRERKRVERLVSIVKALVINSGKGNHGGVAMAMSREPDGIPPSVLQELHELSLSFDASSPMSMPIPSPSPSPSPHRPTRHQHSPNIFITSPTSPSLYPNSHSHSRSPSRDSDTRSNTNAHTTLPTLSIPNAISSGPSQFMHPNHTPSSSPTTSEFGPNMFSQGQHPGLSHRIGGRMMRQPNIMLTLETDDDGRVEKRARTEGGQGHVDGSLPAPSDVGMLGGEEMDIIPSEAEDVKLPSPTGMGVGNKVVGLRGRSDSASMWDGSVGGDGSPAHGGLSANWTGRGRSGGSFGP